MRCLFYNCTGTNPNGSGRRVPNLENRCNKMSLENHGELRETRMRHAAAIAARGLHTSEAGPVCHSEQTPSHLHGSRNSANVTRHEMSANPSPMLPSTVGISGASNSSWRPHMEVSAQNHPAQQSKPMASAKVATV